jgi:thioredoxin-dependent adenylylsulfate APS reductase
MVQQRVRVNQLRPPLAESVRSLASEYEARPAEDVIRWALDTFGPMVAISTSFQAEGMVILDMAHRVDPDVKVFTIDTGRLPQETYELIDRVRDHYGISVQVYYPDHEELSQMVGEHGINPFYRSVSLRLLCCQTRKVNPLNRALKDLDAWMAGLRRSQTETRASAAKIEVDTGHGSIIKVNPLADWSHEQVWEYIRANQVPYNELYDKGYTSIGCAPCTRPIEPGEDFRAGRWWWEEGMPKECGIHMGPAWGRTM